MHIYFELFNDVGHLIRVNADGCFLTCVSSLFT